MFMLLACLWAYSALIRIYQFRVLRFVIGDLEIIFNRRLKIILLRTYHFLMYQNNLPFVQYSD